MRDNPTSHIPTGAGQDHVDEDGAGDGEHGAEQGVRLPALDLVPRRSRLTTAAAPATA